MGRFFTCKRRMTCSMQRTMHDTQRAEHDTRTAQSASLIFLNPENDNDRWKWVELLNGFLE